MKTIVVGNSMSGDARAPSMCLGYKINPARRFGLQRAKTLCTSVISTHLASSSHSEVVHNDAALLKHKTKLAFVSVLKSLQHII